MAEERLNFDDQSYNAFYAAQHVGRYAALRYLVGGKQVLDVACGEGYGAQAMAAWGAAEVVGVDISAEAISKARSFFDHPNVSFHAHDAHTVNGLLSGRQFDVITCFETIEHLKNPLQFLSAIKSLARDGALIVISCPNDKADFAKGHANPFHHNAYDLQEFQRLTEGVLGSCSEWLLGTPQQGMINFPVDDLTAVVDGSYLAASAPTDIPTSLLIPPQTNVAPSEANCLYFVGVWGAPIGRSLTASTLSYPAFISPWEKIQHLETQLGVAEAKLARVVAELQEARTKIATLRHNQATR